MEGESPCRRMGVEGTGCLARRCFLTPGFFLDQDRKEGSQMRCLPLNPCEVLFPASKQALTSNTFVFQWSCTSTQLALLQPLQMGVGMGVQGTKEEALRVRAPYLSLCIHSGWLGSRSNKNRGPE